MPFIPVRLKTTNPLPGFTWHALDHSVPNSGTGSTTLFYEHRIGVAWDIRGNGKTVLRGGYGAYRMHDSIVDVTNAFANSEGLREPNLFGFGAATLSSECSWLRTRLRVWPRAPSAGPGRFSFGNLLLR